MPITLITIVGRTLLALLFILAGAAKIAGPQPFLDHMAAHHIPGVLLPLVIVLELGAGTALLIGWQLSWSAGALALFCVATAFAFHLDLADKAEHNMLKGLPHQPDGQHLTSEGYHMVAASMASLVAGAIGH